MVVPHPLDFGIEVPVLGMDPFPNRSVEDGEGIVPVVGIAIDNRRRSKIKAIRNMEIPLLVNDEVFKK